jgi:hypothetical protein
MKDRLLNKYRHFGFVGAALMLVLVLGMGPATCLAQSNRGALAGTIKDSSGAMVADAKISAVDSQTGSTYSTTSSDVGYYRFPEMAVGVYSIKVERDGFETAVQENVIIQLNAISALDITLTAGSVTETVTVSAGAAALETESSDISTNVSPEQVTGLPLIVGGQGGLGAMRSPQAFAFLAPGAVGPGSGGTFGGPFISSIGGGQAYDEEIMLDGADVLNSENGTIIDDSLPSIESFLEFHVTTSNTSAEYGRNAGDVESFTTKSGTNSFHGNAYLIFRDTILDANNWFNNGYLGAGDTPRSLYARSPDDLKDYGLTFGGPVLIPKVYNGRDKLFGFFSWEQFRQNAGAVTISTLPTTPERTGDFADRLGAAIPGQTNPCNGQPIYAGEIFDPTTTQTVGGQACRLPFDYNGQLNVIDPTREDSVTSKVLGFVPQPNLGTGLLANNYAFAGTNPTTVTTDTIRVDYNASSKDKTYFMYAARENLNDSNVPFLPQPVDGTNVQDHYSRYARVGWDHFFNPTLLNHLNLGYNRVQSPQVAISGTTGHQWPTELGITGALPGVVFPSFSLSEGTSLGASIDRHLADNGYRFNDNLSWQHGQHSLTVGSDWRFQRWNANSNTDNSGAFSYNRNETAPLPGDTGEAGNGYASFFIGAADEGYADVPLHQPSWLSHYLGFFVEDDFKMSRDLTLNLGFRWDEDTPRRENFNDSSIISLSLANPGAGGIPGAYEFASNCSGCNPTWASTWTKDFAPRLGFAWSPEFVKDTVLRGGYGIFYTALQYADGGTGMQEGYAATPTFLSPDSFTPAFYIGQTGFPAYPPPPNLNPAIANNGSPDYIDRTYGRPGMIQSYNLNIEHQLPGQFLFSVGYVGHHATHTRSNVAYINNLPDKFMADGASLHNSVTGGPYSAFSGTLGQSLRPFPQYFSINTWEYLENEGQNSYNSLQVKLERQFHNGFSLLSSYTFAKTLSDADALLPTFGTYAGGGGIQDPENLKSERSVSQEDIPQMFVTSYLYDLPIGKGKAFLNQGGVTNAIIGGFHVGGVNRYQAGQPLVISCATGIPGMDTCIRYNQVPGVSLSSGAKQSGGFNPFSATNNLYLNLAAFQDPNLVPGGANTANPTLPYVFGNLPRQLGTVRTPNYLEEDLVAGKTLTLTEWLRFDLRAEFNNAFNRHVFGGPNTNPASPGFGTITGLDDQPRKIQLYGQFLF